MPILTTFLMRLPVWPFQDPLRTRLGKIGHLVQHGMNLGHHVFAVHDDGCPSRCAQGHVQNGAVFREIDFIAPEHGVDPRAQAGFLGQLQEELESLIGDAILRIIQKKACRFGRHALAAFGIAREKIPQMMLPILAVSHQGFPRPTFGEWFSFAAIAYSLSAGTFFICSSSCRGKYFFAVFIFP